LARLGRYFLPDQPLHVIQRGNNRGAVFFCDDDHARYRDWLAEAADDYGCLVHAYVLMTNHVHLLVTPRREDSLPRTMQSLGRRYVRHVNAARRRSGTLWEGCYRAAPIDSEVQFVRPGEEANHQNDIFALEEHGNPLNRPLTQWLGPRKLQITVPNRSLIGRKKRRHEDVEIVIKYDPDDPAEKARFLKELGFAPERGGAGSTAPLEATCTAD
jgi:REP element-mobilizing transposase RayT